MPLPVFPLWGLSLGSTVDSSPFLAEGWVQDALVLSCVLCAPGACAGGGVGLG